MTTWTFTDGTIVSGQTVAGDSRFAAWLREGLDAARRGDWVGVRVDPVPISPRQLKVTDTELLGAWLRQEARVFGVALILDPTRPEPRLELQPSIDDVGAIL